MAEKPSYIGLLNAIANGEARAGIYLKAWANKTQDPAVRQTLTTVAIRESEHGLAFEKRLCELGYGLQVRPDSGFEERMRVVQSDKNDLEKMEALGFGQERDGADPFDDMFKDHTIDIQTGALLGRYIAEERDSGRLLRACYTALKAQAAPSAAAAAANGDLGLALSGLTTLVKGLQQEVAALRAGNGR